MTVQRLGFDVGNSAVKVGWYADGRLTRTDTIPDHDVASLESFLQKHVGASSSFEAMIASVNRPVGDRLKQALAQSNIPVIREWVSDGSLFQEGLIASAVETPETVGVDRLLATIAALSRSNQRGVLVVTCGSAITLNLATHERVFHGGAIFPGIPLMASSLDQGTHALPLVDIARHFASTSDTPPLPGRSTVSAILAGIFHTAVAGIDRIARELQSSTEGPLDVYLTGGDARFLRMALATPNQFVPDLVLEGLGIAAGIIPGPTKP